MKNKIIAVVSVMAAFCVMSVVMFLGAGCEGSGDDSSASGYMTIYPQNHIMGDEREIIMSAKGAVPPISCSVESSIGRVEDLDVNDISFSYIAVHDMGYNVITVVDSQGASTRTKIYQYALDIEEVSVTEIRDREYMYRLHAVGGFPPFTWEIADATLGFLSGIPNDTSSMYYTTVGDVALPTDVVVTDIYGANVAWMCIPPVEEPLEITPPSATVAYNESVFLSVTGGRNTTYEWSLSEPSWGTLVTHLPGTTATYTRTSQAEGTQYISVTCGSQSGQVTVIHSSSSTNSVAVL